VHFKLVFHFNRIVAKRSVFLCFLTTRVELMTSTQKRMLRYVTIRLKWKTGFKDGFPFQPYRNVTYRSIFFCVEVISSTLVVRKQRNTLRFATIRLKWKTSFSRIVPKRSVFFFLSTRVELITLTQKKMLRYTVEMKIGLYLFVYFVRSISTYVQELK
jgi:hypothetical protein